MSYNRSLDVVLRAWADSAYAKAPSGLNLSCDSEGALYSYRMMIARHVGATATWVLDPNAQPNPSPSVTTTRHMCDAWSYSARDNRAVLPVPKRILLPLLDRLDCLRTGAEPGDPDAHLRLAARRLTHG